MRFKHLDDWLNWQQTLNPAGIELGLARVRKVYDRLILSTNGSRVITVAGTNGKGSTVACYETWLKNRGHQVASYTSPHLLRYNERIKLNLEPVQNDLLCSAFDRVDQAREDIALTFFEFGTLAALDIFHHHSPDYTILEVGLGGRLDAVNIIDPDLAHITQIGLDHQAWLGETREQIGREKAGILRPNVAAVCNDRNPPQTLQDALNSCHAATASIGVDYDYQWLDDQRIHWANRRHSLSLVPPLAGRHQAENISGVLAGLDLLGCLEDAGSEDISKGFIGLTCRGRLEEVASKLPVPLIVDVGHNVDAARVLADFLRNRTSTGRTVVLLGMLNDKDPNNFTAILSKLVDEWWCLGLDGERGQTAQELANKVVSASGKVRSFESVQIALTHAMSSLNNQDILLVTGSFMTVEAVLKTAFVKSG